MESNIVLRESKPNKSMIETLDPKGWIIQPCGALDGDNEIGIQIFDAENNLQAYASVSSADKGSFQKLTQLNQDSLTASISLNSVWLSADVNVSETLPAILYLALRRGRILGKKNVVMLVPIPNPEMPIATFMRLERLNKIPHIKINDRSFIPMAQKINYCAHYLYQQCFERQLKLINDHFLDEVLEIHRAWLDRFYQGSWCQAVITGTLTKEQYIESLFNLHEYVRQTTRLAARGVAHSDDLTMRNQYINHLRGEINHELIIESDLKYLGADVEYLKTFHVPSSGTKEFMVVQESTIGFYQDPVLMLACPLAAEGASAHMQPEFLDQLKHLIGQWGVKEPEKAMKFLSSHVNTDGGDDGHWINVVNIIKRYVNNENKQQKFLSVLIAAMNGFERGFNTNIEEMKLWSAAPTRELQSA